MSFFRRAMLALALVCLPLHAADSSALDSLWREAGEAYGNQRYDEAVTKWESWLQAAANSGFTSAEAHYDLGLAYWNLQQAGPAVFHILKSASLRTFPPRVWSEIITLTDLESSLTIKEGLTRQFFFRYFLLVGTNLQILLFCLGIWCLGTLAVVVWFHRQLRTSKLLKHGLLWTAAICIIIAGTGLFNRTLFCNFAVINTPKGPTRLLRTPAAEGAEALIELPSGTVVNVQRYEGEFAQVTYPLVGWVPKSVLLLIN